ncbi:type II toxin-antitoxin system PemK/MazF family toxin [Methylocystis rosea]|uniref:Uncharacterized protein n=1 Tax=Methylocystis rosea TaxID=173366 RepID=A0A3G8M613_9HYPH|nr:type II toxin-antitoxin system PemK/MazF family toxin [Methylocystis rosea]AZG76318.1 hypothetical protein EHO51_06010 [Methylocystis rosea]
MTSVDYRFTRGSCPIMPHAFRIYKVLKGNGFSDTESDAIASIVEQARTEGARFSREKVANILFDGGFEEAASEAIAEALRNCYGTEKFNIHFDQADLKFKIVRAKIHVERAQFLLDTIFPAVVTRRDAHPRVIVRYAPRAGSVVMCDFTHLSRPEMVKERRAIVISGRSSSCKDRCTVVPVSMKEYNDGKLMNHKFEAGKYPFFSKDKDVWAICDHIYTVSLSRLWQVVVLGRPSIPAISEGDLCGVRDMARAFIGPAP